MSTDDWQQARSVVPVDSPAHLGGKRRGGARGQGSRSSREDQTAAGEATNGSQRQRQGPWRRRRGRGKGCHGRGEGIGESSSLAFVDSRNAAAEEAGQPMTPRSPRSDQAVSETSASSEKFELAKQFAEQFLLSVDIRSGSNSTVSVQDRGESQSDTQSHSDDTQSQSGSDQPTRSLSAATSRKLAGQIHNKTAQLAKVWKAQRRSTMLARIDEIPNQVGASLQTSAKDLVDHVQLDIDNVRRIIFDFFMTPQRGDRKHPQAEQAERALNSIESVPEIVRIAFEKSVVEVQLKAQSSVDTALAKIELDELNELNSDHIAESIWKILPAVQEAAHQAVEEAAQASKSSAKRQLEFACATLPESSTLYNTKMRIVQMIPEAIPNAEAAAADVATGQVEQAVADMESVTETTRDVSNQVVAEALLLAKASPSNHATPAQAEATPAQPIVAGAVGSRGPRSNPELEEDDESNFPLDNEEGLECANQGSFGHPDFCSRACLYFTNGQCLNGNECSFCHLGHRKRSVHLDKRHREMLKDMHFSERAHLIFPILLEKVKSLDLGAEALQLLEELYKETTASYPCQSLSSSPCDAGGDYTRVQRMNRRSLGIVLAAMNVRSLLLMLNGRAGGAEWSPPQDLIRSFLQHCRVQSYLRHQKGDVLK